MLYLTGAYGDDYLAVGVEDGYLVYTFDLGSGAALLRSPEKLNLSKAFHTLDLGRYRKEGWMKVSLFCSQEFLDQLGTQLILLDYTHL